MDIIEKSVNRFGVLFADESKSEGVEFLKI